MKTIVCRISAILLLLFIVCGIKAQDQVSQGETTFAAAPTISAEDDAMLQKRAAEKIGQMCDYISFIANKSFDYKTRQYYSDKALNLFIAQGKSYNEIINGEEVVHDGVQIQLNEKFYSKYYLIRDYLPRMAALKYDSIMIQTTEVGKVKVSNLKKINDDLYSCTCYFDLSFIGFSREDKPIFTGITPIKVECYISIDKTPDGDEYCFYLGNVTAKPHRYFKQL